MKFNKILIAGCSFASGEGLEDGITDSRNWTNQLANKLLPHTVKNIAQSGANNQWIFLETMSALIRDKYDLVLVEWSAIPRYAFNIGLELYSVKSTLNKSVNLVGNQTLSESWLLDIKKKLMTVHNDHWDMLDLVKYVNVLIELQVKARQGKIFFINGLGPWTDQYFVKKQITLPSDLDVYTYNLLQSDQRDDTEVFQLYDMIHHQYSMYGGIQEQYWLNLYQSQLKTRIDYASETDHHPGYLSQDMYADNFYNTLIEKLNTNETSNHNNTRRSKHQD